MAIKIKRKRNKDENEPEEGAVGEGTGEEGEEGGEGGEGGAEASGKPVDPIDELLESDKFIEAADASFGWAQKHRSTLIGVFVVVALVIVGVVVWTETSATSQLDQSAALTEGIKVLDGEVKSAAEEPTPEPERKKNTPPKLQFETDKARYEALLEKADAALARTDGEAKGPAQLMKARALVGLGRAEEAITIYQEWLNAHKTVFERPLVLQAMAAAQAQAGKVDEAEKTLEELKAVDEKVYGEFASYETARIYDQAGKKDQAKERYEAFVKAFPESEKVEWARMRIDTM